MGSWLAVRSGDSQRGLLCLKYGSMVRCRFSTGIIMRREFIASLVGTATRPLRGVWVLIALMILAPSSAQAQVRVICQTPRFWCAFFIPAPLPNGTACHCGTPSGLVVGYSIIDTGRPPSSPAPQTYPAPTFPPQMPGVGGTSDPNDCYRGLGNCGGSYYSGTHGTGGGPQD
jgi:hypothetical protein